MSTWSPTDLDVIPSLGWVTEPVPVTEVPELAQELGFSWLGIHREDLLKSWYGGTKQRKLNYLLAVGPFCSVPSWVSMGAIGSGQLAALTGAAERLGKRVDAICVWQPPGESVLANLAQTASGPADIHYYRHFATAALGRPGMFLSNTSNGHVVVPMGATHPVGIIGVVRAALELGVRIRAGEVPEPDVIVVARGTGGTAAGLALGMAMAGYETRVLAVNVVPAIVASRRKLMADLAACYALMCRATGRSEPLPTIRLDVERGFVGRGYGHPTQEGLAAMARVPVKAEPVYTGKALAALMARAPKWRGKRVLYWHTQHGPLPEPNPKWRENLPSGLQTDLAAGTSGLARRMVIRGGLAGAALLAAGAYRTTGYAELADWRGQVLAAWEAQVLMAAVTTVIPDVPGGELPPGPSARTVVENIDRYLVSMPGQVKLEIHGLVALVEHGTGLGLRAQRFTRLSAQGRADALAGLHDSGALIAFAHRGLRDLCYLGWYQDERTWGSLDYDGRRLPPGGGRTYAELVAPAGAPQ